MKHAVVTGAAGFLGSHFVDALLEDEYRVTGLDNFVTGKADNLSADPRFTFRQCDVSRPLPVIGGFVDLVAHFASPASPTAYQARPVHTLAVNSAGTRNALELAWRDGAQFLLASSSEVYGCPDEFPQSETYWGNVNPVGPRSMYDEGKRFAEALTTAFQRHRKGLDTRIARIFNTYGPGMRPDDGRLIPTLIRQARACQPFTIYGSGTQTRSFCYVTDLIDGLMKLLAADEFHGPVNLGRPTPHTVLQVAQTIADLRGIPLRIDARLARTDDPLARQPDIRLARKVLGWEPKVMLRDGLRRTLEAEPR